MTFNADSTLRVLFFVGDVNGDANEFSGNTFVTTCMLLVINMIAEDLHLTVELLSDRLNGSRSIDIYVDDENNNADVERIWPHYQNRYCFIYSNTVRISPQEVLHNWSSQHIAITVSWILGWIFYCIILFLRKSLNWFKIISQAYSYSIQSEVMSSIPSIKLSQWQRFLIGSKFIHNLLIGSLHMSYFASIFIAPHIRLVTDDEAAKLSGRSIEQITDFGIGEPCLFELMQGIYIRRGCFIACDVANKTVQGNEGIVFLREEVNFQNVFKVSKKSSHSNAIKRLLRIYLEAGLLDRIFNHIHVDSHKFLEEMQNNEQIRFSEVFSILRDTIVIGSLCALFALICELAYFKWQQRQIRNRQQNRALERQLIFEFVN